MLDKQFIEATTETRADHISRISNALNSVPALQQRLGRGFFPLIQAEATRTLEDRNPTITKPLSDTTLLPETDHGMPKGGFGFTEIITMPGIDESKLINGLPMATVPSLTHGGQLQTYEQRMTFASRSDLRAPDIWTLDNILNPMRFVTDFNLREHNLTTDGPFGRLLINRLNLWMGKYFPEFPNPSLNRLQYEPIRDVLKNLFPALKLHVIVLDNPKLKIGKASPLDLQSKRLMTDLAILAHEGLAGVSRLTIQDNDDTSARHKFISLLQNLNLKYQING